ncbi:MAG: SprB repeat-containing protein [Bacteroidia bacterium]|nr:SprB repeat-containing protein [Bacteroidia bacterium]
MKKSISSLISALLLTLILPLSSQTTFRLSYDVGAFDISGGMVENPAGEFVIAGLNNSFGPYYGNAVKIDANGTVVWAKAYTAGFATNFSDIKNVSTGGYIITGSSTNGGGGALLVRIDNSGAVLWAKKYQLPDRPASNASNEYGNAVIETSDGGFLVGGGVDYFWDGVSGTTVDTSSAMGFKVDANGVLQWSKVWTISTTNPDEHYINDVAESADGYFFVGQSSEGSGTLSSNGDYPSNSLIIKTTTAGTLTYLRRWGAGNTSSQGINSALRLTTGANAGKILLGGFDDIHAFLITVEGIGGTPTMGAFNRRINGAAFPPRTLIIQDIMENSDGNYSVIGMQIEPLSFAFYTAIYKINSGTGALIFGRGYAPIGLSAILPEGGLCADQGYYVTMTDQQSGGFNYNVIRTNNVGQLGPGVSACNSTNLNPGTTTYSTTLTTPTNANFNLATESSFVPTVSNMVPVVAQHCLNVACVPPAAATTVTANPNPICAGQSTTITASGPGSGVVYNVFTTSTGGSSIGATPLVVTPGTTTTYYVETAISGQPGCLSTIRTPVTVTVNPLPTASAGGNSPLCAGSNLNLTSGGGTSYAWTGPNSYSNATQNPTISGVTAAASGTYSVVVTDANSCSATATIVISVVTNPTVSIASPTNVLCNGGSTGAATASVSGGNGTNAYSWAPAGGTAATASGLAQGNYTVTVTSGGCVGTQTVAITQPTAISTTTTSTNASCGGSTGSATVNASGGTGSLTYSWAPSGGTAATASALAANTYTCTITDANSCTSTVTVVVSNTGGPTASLFSQTNVLCNGGSTGDATVNASGGTGTLTYSWAPSGGTAATATGLSANTYTCTVTDGAGCTQTQTVIITEAPAITTTTASVNAACGSSNGTATVNASGGTGALTYSWAPAGGSASTTIGVPAATYTCTITDASSCTQTVSVVVNNSTGPSVSLFSQTNITCFGGINGDATVNASGGTGSLTYSWSPSGGTAATATGLSANTYTCTVTDGAGCIQTQTVTIIEPPAISTSTSSVNASCGMSDGSATVNASGGTGSLTYSWAPAGGTASTTIGVPAATYTCTITDANACTNTVSVIVNNTGGPTANAIGNGPLCAGSTLILSGAGGVGYSWAGPNGFTDTNQNPTISGATTAESGTYTLTVTDAGGCTATNTVSVIVNASPAATASVTAVSICAGSTINLNSSGGGTYSWSGPNGFTDTNQNPTITGATTTASGTYTVVVTIGTCTASATTSAVTVNALPVSTASGNGPLCAGNIINLNSTGGGTYSWAGPNGFTVRIF